MRKFLRELNTVSNYEKKLSLLKHPFLIFDGKLREGDHYKDRYFYKGGFGELLTDVRHHIEKESLIMGYEVGKVQR